MDPLPYSRKVCLVTGSRRGVGRGICEHLLEQGGTVLGFSRSVADFAHPRYHHYQVDITQATQIAAAFVDIRRQFKVLHILVNNAAVLTSQYALLMPPGEAKRMLETNLLGPFLVSKESAKLMRKANWGRIINISSMAVALEPMGDSIYAATKAGLATIGNILAKEFAPFHITVNTLGITAIKTDMLDQLPLDKIQEIIDQLPLPQFARMADILHVIDVFASEASSCLTAQTLFLGGVHI